ncbi:hypothetical protein ACFL4N_05705 [Thermodesulfobacteriota bacterium]
MKQATPAFGRGEQLNNIWQKGLLAMSLPFLYAKVALEEGLLFLTFIRKVKKDHVYPVNPV